MGGVMMYDFIECDDSPTGLHEDDGSPYGSVYCIYCHGYLFTAPENDDIDVEHDILMEDM
jgi:hypothetical protein